ncbi:hypothetical protein Fleli_1365 [Bernardetia litoralis DSM 6794]|uniref:Lipoprotein n=1 Tax=Bernardetia litoralis (strain ATCC 23117 / DSM 6794 / NBRC 15988 / NCIMB 1366 / Fx l1 / Sio-4) TaxID=880071 RepID=I4AIL2_BERLS|nr:hypothetical protein [Bernardetia litoralis]AFM03797.1 hypothetical protein Fleli_1365 [Bernardetia litoralis DSM 6794]
MKYLVIIGLLFLSSCCWNDKDGSCSCEPPNPELTEEVLKWISPYENEEFFIFKDEEGNIDSLKVERVSETAFCGGDECGSNCKVEMAILSSITNPVIRFNIVAREISIININYRYNENKFMSVEYFGYIYSQENIAANFVDGILNIDCLNDLDCSDYNMKSLKISKQEGLIEYTTADNMKWTKIN